MNATPPPGYRTQSEDTSYTVEQMLFERWRSLSSDQKAEIVEQASLDLHCLCVAGLKHRLPDASPDELEIRAMALKYGKDSVLRVLGIDVPDESVRIP